MRSRLVVALVSTVAVAVLAAGCAQDHGKAVVARPLDAVSSGPPVYDPTLEPAAAVMAVVPPDATTLRVTDDAEIKLELGFADLTSASPAADRARFAAEAARSARLDAGLLAPYDAQLRARFDFGQDDVEWEAHFSGPSGAGWVLKLRDDLPAAGPTQAVAAGVGPLTGATYYPTAHVILEGGTLDPTQSWAADPSLIGLVGQVAAATYVQRSCVPFEVAFGPGVREQLAPGPAAEVDALAPVDAFSVAFGASLVTVQLEPMRSDAFDRARLADVLPETDPAFGRGYSDPVADPVGGRIGYTLGDASVAAQLALQQHLPFAVCAIG